MRIKSNLLKGLCLSLAFLITSSGRADSSAATPVITAMSTAGQIPYTVHVHALNSQLSSGDWLTHRFEWDFDDPGTEFNTVDGFNAAHTYDLPGIYTVTLRITAANGAISEKTLSVHATPSQRSKIYISAQGNDNNNGATQGTPIKSIARANQLTGNNKDILFRAGDVFVDAASLELNFSNVLVSTYGGAAQAHINYIGNNSKIIDLSGNCANITIQNLGLDSPDNVRGIQVAGTNITVRDCDFADLDYAMNSEFGVTGWLTQRNTADILNKYYAWCAGSDHVHLGNSIQGSATEHNFRFGGVERSLIHANYLENPILPGEGASKSCVWAMRGEFGYISGNIMVDGKLDIGPKGDDQTGTADPADRFKWLVVEGNDISGNIIVTRHGAEHIMFRNNIIHHDDNSVFLINGYDDYFDRTSLDIRIVNNTAINNDIHGRFVECTPGVEEVSIVNNLYVAPNLISGVHRTANVFINDDTMDGFVEITRNVWSHPVEFTWVEDGYHYLWPYWGEEEGYRTPTQWETLAVVHDEIYETIELDGFFGPPLTSEAATHAGPYPGVFNDYHGNPRDLNSAWSAGAVEAGLGGPPPIEDDPTNPLDPRLTPTHTLPPQPPVPGPADNNPRDFSSPYFFPLDNPLTEGGVSRPPMSTDTDRNGSLTINDLTMLLRNWGGCQTRQGDCAGDLNRDGAVDALDMMQMIDVLREVDDPLGIIQ